MHQFTQQKQIDLANVRKATIEDVTLLSQLTERTFRDTYNHNTSGSDIQDYILANFSIEVLQKELESPGTFYFVIAGGPGLAAYLKISELSQPPSIVPGKAMEISSLYVVNAFQGRGMGSGLMALALQHANTQGFESVWLSVWEKNPRAISFYEKLGFQRAGTLDFRVGSDLQKDFVYWFGIRSNQSNDQGAVY